MSFLFKQAGNGVRVVLLVLCPLIMISCAGVKKDKKTEKDIPMLGAKTWRSYDGKIMPWHAGKEISKKDVKAVVITVHGLSGAAMDFWMLEDNWPPKGIAVYGMQLRGQGNDPDVKKRGTIDSATTWQKDLITFHELVRQQHPDAPIFWYTESLGTLIAMHAITDRMPDASNHPSGIIMSAPAAGLRLRPSAFRHALLNTAIITLPWVKVNLEKMSGVEDKDIRVTHDTTHGAQMAVTSHYVSHFSLRLLGQIDKMMRAAPASAAKLQIPVLILASPNDVIASEPQIQDLYEKIGSRDKQIFWFRHSYHLLLHDTQREEVLQTATDWVESQINSAAERRN